MYKRCQSYLKHHKLTIIFINLCIIGLILSDLTLGQAVEGSLNQSIRYLVFTFALILPILIGFGFNFGIVIGAIAGQLAVFCVVNWQLTGLSALISAFLITTIISTLLGLLTSWVMTRCRQPMITSLFIGYITNGLYQFVMIFLMGSIIPVTSVLMKENKMVYSYMLEKTFPSGTLSLFIYITVLFICYESYRFFRQKSKKRFFLSLISFGLSLIFYFTVGKNHDWIDYHITYFSSLLIALSLLVTLFFKSLVKKHHQERLHHRYKQMMAITLSTILSAWGQLILLDQTKVLITYSASVQIAFFVIPCLIIGGGTLKNATVLQAILGTFLFHGFLNLFQNLITQWFDGNLTTVLQSIMIFGILLYGLIQKKEMSSKLSL